MKDNPQVIVLNVDDQDAPRYVKSRDLREAGFTVIEARTGAEALRLVEQEKPPVVLLDVQLPDITGYEVCAFVKKKWPEVMVLLTSSTPETVNPVATKAEALGTPLICGNVPWQAWYANLGGNPTPGKSTFKPKNSIMYFLGVNDLCEAFIAMWNRIHAQLHTNKIVGCTFPNDSDGNAFRAAWPIFAHPAGYTLVDPPPYTDGLTNYSSMINQFKETNCEFFTNVPLPPDFNVMWKQAAQQGFKPKLATVAKVLLFPSDVTALVGTRPERGS